MIFLPLFSLEVLLSFSIFAVNPSKITMLEKPSAPVDEGNPLKVTCETDSTNPVADIQFHRRRNGENWHKLTTNITNVDRDGKYGGRIRKSTLTVTADRLDNQALFDCKVRRESPVFQIDQTTTVTVYCKYR